MSSKTVSLQSFDHMQPPTGAITAFLAADAGKTPDGDGLESGDPIPAPAPTPTPDPKAATDTETPAADPDGKDSTAPDTTGAVAEPDNAAEPPTDGEDDADAIPAVEIDGQVYPVEDVRDAIKTRENRDKWQKENTRRAEENAKTRKEIDALRGNLEPLVQLAQDLKAAKKPELVQDIRDAIKADLGDDVAARFDAILALNPETVPHPAIKRVEELEAKVSAYEAEKAYNNALNQVAEQHGLSAAQKKTLDDFIVQHYQDTGEGLTPEDAFYRWDYPRQKDEAQKAKRYKVLNQKRPGQSAPNKAHGPVTIPDTKPKAPIRRLADMAPPFDAIKAALSGRS